MLAANHVDAYRSPAGAKIDAWNTVDASLLWAPNVAEGPFSGLSLTLSVQNLFDRDPPFYDNPLGVGYDPANADPLGRVVAVQLAKRW
jgi:outer membrane receptor protein involved in Fe transport